MISTHTLTWSVTQKNICRTPIKSFQLTRSRGAWLLKRRGRKHDSKFQLTRSRGAWPYCSGVIFPLSAISTHTLTWSVTFGVQVALICMNYFNSHAHVERDCETPPTPMPPHSFQLTRSRGAWQISGTSTNVVFLFQLTRSRGAWRIEAKKEQLLVDFNSHAHVERDIIRLYH